MQHLLHKLSQHLPRKQIFHQLVENDPSTKILILERFNIFSIANGPGLVLHRFNHSDPDRGYHDHPWTFGISLILSGSYNEIKVSHSTKEMNKKVFNPGSLNYFTGRDYHRVVLNPKIDQEIEISEKSSSEIIEVDEHEVWTLFFHWKREKQWGFLKENGGGWKFNQYSKTIEDSDGAWWKVEPKLK